MTVIALRRGYAGVRTLRAVRNSSRPRGNAVAAAGAMDKIRTAHQPPDPAMTD